MSERSNEKQVSFFMDEKEREQFRLLCKTTGISVANVLRSWIQQALKDQHIEVNVPPDARTLQLQTVSSAASSNSYDDTVIKGMLERIDKVERIFNYIDEDELEFMKNEILNDKFGTVRNRLGVVESILQNKGSSIAWEGDNATTNN